MNFDAETLIVNALRVAAETYQKDADEIAVDNEGMKRLRAQFLRQVSECRIIANVIEADGLAAFARAEADK